MKQPLIVVATSLTRQLCAKEIECESLKSQLASTEREVEHYKKLFNGELDNSMTLLKLLKTYQQIVAEVRLVNDQLNSQLAWLKKGEQNKNGQT